MKTAAFRRMLMFPVAVLIVQTVPMMLHAQVEDAPEGGKVLVIQREFTKPGKDGAMHEATEAGYKRAAAAGNAAFHYIALTSLSGENRALFLSSYPSFSAMEAEHKSIGETLAASLDKAMVADGDVLSSTDASAWVVRPDLSTNTKGMRTGSRYMIVRQFVIKPGHQSEWTEAVKLVMDAYKRGVPEAHWTMYQMAFGHSTGPTFLVLTSIKSMDEVDGMFGSDPKFMEALGGEGLKKLEALEQSSVETSMSNVFSVNAKMSIPTEDMVKAEPAFWKAAPKPASKKTVSTKPAE